MHHNAKLVTVFPYGYGLGAPSAATHIGATPMNQQADTHGNTGRQCVSQNTETRLYASLHLKKRKKKSSEWKKTRLAKREKGMHLWLYLNMLLMYIIKLEKKSPQNLCSVLQSTHTGVTFIQLSASGNAESNWGSWLQRSISMWHERLSVGACRMGTHIMALWARQPLSNYSEPSQALLRHALNFAQDRWGPAEYAAESSVPTANRCCLCG